MKNIVLPIALVCGVLATPPSFAQTAVSPNFVDQMRRLLMAYDTVKAIDSGSKALTGESVVMPADVLEVIAAQQRRLERHHPTSHVRAPKVSVDQAFSPDADERGAVRDSYRKYLKDSEAEIKRFREKRSQIDSRRDDWQKYSDVVAGSEGVFEDACASSKHPVTYNNFCGGWADIVLELAPGVQRVLNAYNRVLKDYDQIIPQRSDEVDRKREELETIEILQGERALTPAKAPAPDKGAANPQSGPSHAASLAGELNVAGARASKTVGDKVAAIAEIVESGSRRADELRRIGREQMRDALERQRHDAERANETASNNNTGDPVNRTPSESRSDSPVSHNEPATPSDKGNQKKSSDDDTGTILIP